MRADYSSLATPGEEGNGLAVERSCGHTGRVFVGRDEFHECGSPVLVGLVRPGKVSRRNFEEE